MPTAFVSNKYFVASCVKSYDKLRLYIPQAPGIWELELVYVKKKRHLVITDRRPSNLLNPVRYRPFLGDI